MAYSSTSGWRSPSNRTPRAGEHGAVDLQAQLGILGGAVLVLAVGDLDVLAHQDHAAAAGTAQGLLGGEGDDVGILHGAGDGAAGDQAAVVGAVHPEVSTHLVADLPEALIVDEAGIGGSAHTDQLGLVLQGQAVDLVHVDHLGLTADAIVDGVEHGAAEVELGAVAQVAAVVQGMLLHLQLLHFLMLLLSNISFYTS